MSNEGARGYAFNKSQFLCRRMKECVCRELIVGCRIVGDSLCAKDKYCANALAMHSLILNMVAKDCNMKSQGSKRLMLSTSADRIVDCSSKQSSLTVICKTEGD